MTTRTANDPLRQAEKIRQRLQCVMDRGPQVVYLNQEGRVEICTVGGKRHHALEMKPGFADRVAGVFDHRANAALLAAAIREVLAS